MESEGQTPDHILFGEGLCSCFRCQMVADKDLVIVLRNIKFYEENSATKVTKYEVICVRCKGSMPKMWTQKQYNNHMRKVHDIMNEVHIGADPRSRQDRQLSIF